MKFNRSTLSSTQITILTVLLTVLSTVTVRAQFTWANPPFDQSTLASVSYADKTVLPSAGDQGFTRRLKIKIESSTESTVTTGDVHVWINRSSYNYTYLSAVSPDSTFEFTSNWTNPYVQFVFAGPDSTQQGRLNPPNGVYGWSPTIFVPYGDAFGNVRTSVSVPDSVGFQIVPNPVVGSFTDVHVPASVPRFNSFTRFRIVHVDGTVHIDVPLLDLETNDPTIAFNSLRNGSYVAQLYNVPLGINRVYQFVVNR